jgi:hypothetical protein
MSLCKSCRAPVIWAKSAATGKWMILDAEPTLDGNVVLVWSDQYGRKDAHVYRDGDAAEVAHPGAERRVDHHVTCVSVEDWRGR